MKAIEKYLSIPIINPYLSIPIINPQRRKKTI
jgi:hypothetical protein